MSRSLTSLTKPDEDVAVGITWRGTILSSGISCCAGGGCRVKGGINEVLLFSSHTRERDIGESEVLADIPLDGVASGAADAAPIAPPG